MNQCPQCQNTIDDDFGVVTCGSCGYTFMIDLEGNAVEQDESEASDQHNTSIEEALEPSQKLIEDVLIPDAMDENSEALEENQPETYEDPFLIDENATTDPLYSEEFAEEQSDTLEPQAEEELVEEPLTHDSFEEPKTAEQVESELNAYASSDVSNGEDGEILIDLTISEINGKDIRSEIKSLISDNRYGLDVNKLIAESASGEMIIKAINPVVASSIVKKLIELPIKIQWDQNVIFN